MAENPETTREEPARLAVPFEILALEESDNGLRCPESPNHESGRSVCILHVDSLYHSQVTCNQTASPKRLKRSGVCLAKTLDNPPVIFLTFSTSVQGEHGLNMFRVISALSSADYCSLAGSQVNFVMKTGTNNFHDSAFGSLPKPIDLRLELLWIRPRSHASVMVDTR